MQQYIDFFQSQRQKIDSRCAALVNAEREAAFEKFCRLGLPVYGSEEYQHTDVPALLAPDYGFYIGHSGAPINPHKVFHCNVPNLSSHKHFIVNGQFYKETEAKAVPEGVFSGSMNEFATTCPEVFEKYYNRIVNPEDGLVAFNTMFVQDGYLLYVPKNTILERPIQITHIVKGEIDSLVNRRILIILEDGAQAKILACDHTMEEETKFASTQVVEVYVGENAVFDFYELEESTPNTIRLTANFVKQEASSNVMVNNITLSNGVTRNNYNIALCGEHAETHLYGMAIAEGSERVDNHTNIEHLVPNCHSNELFKYVLDEQAVCAFSGRILVAKDAQKTQAYQNNRNLCVSRTCRMFSKPQLEIYADDVKCSHGLTTGQLDESALFYMRSRGISEKEARLLLKFAFTNDVIEGVRIDSLKDRLRLLVEKRFRGELIKCQGCI